MKPNHLLILAGGLLATVGFFLPFTTFSKDGIFSPGESLLQTFQRTGVTAQNAAFLIEPIAALLLIAGGLFALKKGRIAYLWSLGSAVVGLSFLLLYFSSLYAMLHLLGGLGIGDTVQLLHSGYWLALLGCALALLGRIVRKIWRSCSSVNRYACCSGPEHAHSVLPGGRRCR